MNSRASRTLKQLLATWQTAVVALAKRVTTKPYLPQPPAYNGPDVTLIGLTEKSGEVEPGMGFVARVRAGSDGHPYIGQAIERGASFILAQRSPADLGLTIPEGVVYWQVADTAVTLAYLSAAWYDFPAHHLTCIGVTGTDGKTSTCRLLFEMLRAGGLRVGLLSTIKAVIGDSEEPLALHVTTPEAPAVQRYLRRMVEAGLTHCVLETTSIGLAQHRVDAIPFQMGIVTNITHEHLDYHGQYDGYLAAKARLFQITAQSGGTAVLNRDDSSYEKLAAIAGTRQISYGLHQADVTAGELHYAADQTRFSLHLPGADPLPIATPLVGEFNVYNILAAAAAAQRLHVDKTAVQQGIAATTLISGRMERIDEGQDFLVVVDFAHTPRALEVAIDAGKRMVAARNGRVITVFGSAGKRDVAKRHLMSEISARDADISILTAEDPRTEDLNEILAMMAQGCERQGGVEEKTFWRIPDRGQAIYQALSLARPNDLILICGKGHEQSMCFGTVEHPWDDREATRAALRAFLVGKPMVNLGLPTFSANI
jgi:UDP-N-acetylmuramoyl-L-alanyl-D-glutamate--2,6-diaminopimelate ligase